MAAPAAGQAAAPAAGDGGAQGGVAATGAGGEQDGQQQQEQQAPDFGQLSQQLQGINEMLEGQRDLLESEPWKAPASTESQELKPAVPDLSFLDDTQPGYTPEQAAQGLQDLLNSIAEEKAQALVEPLAKEQQEMRAERETDDLIARYPQMGDDAVASKVIDTSRQWTEMLGHPELATSPQVWEMVYLAGRAADQANQEGAGTGAAATLEGPGGASPGGSGQGAIPTTQSVTSGWKANSLPLFGTRR